MSPLQPTESQLINRPLNRGNSMFEDIEPSIAAGGSQYTVGVIFPKSLPILCFEVLPQMFERNRGGCAR